MMMMMKSTKMISLIVNGVEDSSERLDKWCDTKLSQPLAIRSFGESSSPAAAYVSLAIMADLMIGITHRRVV